MEEAFGPSLDKTRGMAERRLSVSPARGKHLKSYEDC